MVVDGLVCLDLLCWPPHRPVSPKPSPQEFANAVLRLLRVKDGVVKPENVNKVIAMTSGEAGCFANVMDQVRIVPTLPYCPKIDTRRGGTWGVKDGCPFACERKRPRKVEGDGRRRARRKVCLQHGGQPFAKSARNIIHLTGAGQHYSIISAGIMTVIKFLLELRPRRGHCSNSLAVSAKVRPQR